MKLIRSVVLLAVAGFTINGYCQFADLKTMISDAEKAGDDTVKVRLLQDICDSLFRKKPDEAIKYGNIALQLSKSLGYTSGEAYSMKYIGLAHYVKAEYVEAMKYFQQSLDIFESMSDQRGTANILNNIGSIYNNEGNDSKALELYLRSLDLSEQINDSLRIVTALVNIGLIYSKKETTLSKAESAYLKALEINEALGYQVGMGTVTVNLGELYYARGDYKKALSYFERSLEAYKKGNSENLAYTLINIGKIYAKWKYYPNAFKYFEEALTLSDQNDAKLLKGQALIALANTYLQKGDTPNALKYFIQAEKITTEIGALYERRETYEGLAKTYARKLDFKSAYENQQMESRLKDSLYAETNQLQLNQLQIQYEIESMLKENEILKRDARLKEASNKIQLLAIGLLVVGFVLISAFLILLIRSNNQKKRANNILVEKNTLITAQKKAITDSIVYARRIQNALLQTPEQIEMVLPHIFIFFRPRDIVSGDFYWMYNAEGRTFFVVADCTGHGVPGAFMSMLGISLLNEIIRQKHYLRADALLNELRYLVQRSLHQSKGVSISETKDGMDLTLLIFNEKFEKVEFAGANNPLFIVRKGELFEFKPDKMPIGVHIFSDHPFTCHNIDLQKGDMLYTFSDGYSDQFGGPEGKKYMKHNFKNLLIESAALDLPEQKGLIESRFMDWKGYRDQVDDILVTGIRI